MGSTAVMGTAICSWLNFVDQPSLGASYLYIQCGKGETLVSWVFFHFISIFWGIQGKVKIGKIGIGKEHVFPQEKIQNMGERGFDNYENCTQLIGRREVV